MVLPVGKDSFGDELVICEIPEPYITYFLRQSDTSLITGYRSDRRDNARSFKLAQLIDKLVITHTKSTTARRPQDRDVINYPVINDRFQRRFGKKYNVRTSLNLRTGYLLNNPRFSDARFIVGRERRVIHANRYPLIKASEVFSRMFEESLNPAGSIKVKDIKPKIFLEMLRFIYYGSPNIKNCNVRGLLYAAEKYQLSVLRKLCEMVIASSASNTLKCEHVKDEDVQ
ncbi:conserved hypothetical protein [Culex quinquefasciatus]|uniref:BTB domain-containing protein n=1 Tax=Culex quinquefasciatus TaxID=7176 RepID=B0VZP0_CULQU|nr:conserved hypothetical protein [Culex quinquefasciatus]|eukprot:XP_001841924.1 conserved hypothetical protein [Culex quinquefasciatus]